MIDFRVVRCGRPLTRLRGIHVARALRAGWAVSSRMSLPTKVGCGFMIWCSAVVIRLKVFRMCSFFMCSSLTSDNSICRICLIALWWKDSSFRNGSLGGALISQPQSLLIIINDKG